ncbi:imidazoleglycerol-phosphate dehydratase HisB [Staphylococcus chromogenes]|nr:imidazoleglycerol-phosphate dehydratase HisB [Staphylococcus chromogenes]
MRIGKASRKTSESDISVEINVDGAGRVDIDTGVPFLDHMLTAFGVHGCFDLTVKAVGDTHIDAHHTVEDTAIVMGQALLDALGPKRAIRRFGTAQVPMDEALCEAIVDISGRPYFVLNGEPEHLLTSVIGGHYPTVINAHFFETLASNSRITLHIRCHYGRDPHHITEAEFKAVARALREALSEDARLTGVPSTKGAL